MKKEKLITLAEFIKELGITTQEFCNRTGMSYSYIARIKNDINPKVELETVIKIYEATGLTCWRWLELPNFWEVK